MISCGHHPGMSCGEAHQDDFMRIETLTNELEKERRMKDAYREVALRYYPSTFLLGTAHWGESREETIDRLVEEKIKSETLEK